MRWLSLIALCTASSLFGGGIARAATDDIFHISNWVGRAHRNQQEKRLDHCSAQLTNPDNISIIYSLDSQYRWSLDFTNPSWNFPNGATFDVTFGLGKSGNFKNRVIATAAQQVNVQLQNSLDVFALLRKVFQIDLIAGGLTSHFNLTYNNQVLTALTRCVVSHGASSQNRAATAAWLRLLSDSEIDNKADSAKFNEASALITNIMTQASITKGAIAKPSEIPTGVTGDAIWKVGSALFTMSILSQNATPKFGDLPGLIVGAEAQKCRGDFFSGATLEVETLPVARVFADCHNSQAATSIYYFAIPRKQGGLYLFATITSGVEITLPGEPSAADFDGKIRSAIVATLPR